MSDLAALPEPPYYAVIFTSTRHEPSAGDGYDGTADAIEALATEQPGYLGIESVEPAGGLGITVSYWADLDAVAAWKRHVDHLAAQDEGRARWYQRYAVRVARVERAYGWERPAR